MALTEEQAFGPTISARRKKEEELMRQANQPKSISKKKK